MMSKIKPFKSRTQAGEILSIKLERYRHDLNAIVLALPRGGVPVGVALAKKLGIALDVMLARKLGVPGHEEFAMGAIASGGICVLQPETIKAFDIPVSLIEVMARRQLHEIQQREKSYRSGRAALSLEQHTVILTDDGLATGATMLAAIRAAHKQHPAYVIVAVPVGPLETCRKLEQEVNEVICLHTPEPFYAVGVWYENFAQISDAEVTQLMDASNYVTTFT